MTSENVCESFEFEESAYISLQNISFKLRYGENKTLGELLSAYEYYKKYHVEDYKNMGEIIFSSILILLLFLGGCFHEKINRRYRKYYTDKIW